MSLKRIRDLTGTLAFRITAWYAFVFTLSSLLALSIFYYKISVIQLNASDSELMEEIEEFTNIMSEGGVEDVKQYMAVEAGAEGDDVFFRLYSSEGRLLAMEGDFLLDSMHPPEKLFEILRNGEKPVLKTLNLPDDGDEVRTIYGRIGPETILQAGISLEENEKYLKIFRRLLLNLIFPMFLMSTVIGWFLARHALKGVEEVSLTAIEITKGAYEKRVRVKKRLLEVDRLAKTFNTMVERNQALLKGMSEITDNVAHDLRSPLTRIRGIAEMTLVGKSSISDYEKMAASTIEECDTLIHLINTMLDITEVEAGVGIFKSEPVDLKKLLLDACDLFRPLADEKDIQLLTRLPEAIPLQGDKSMLQRMVTNLLENAIKYTGTGGQVTVSADITDGQVHIVFTDTGIGISEKDLPKIFERFYRCDNSRTMPGTGLGLCLVKAIVNALGGDVHVKSALTEGSTFIVTLPA